MKIYTYICIYTIEMLTIEPCLELLSDTGGGEAVTKEELLDRDLVCEYVYEHRVMCVLKPGYMYV